MRRRLPILLLALALLLATAGLASLLLRPSSNVPAYSTLGTDPVGARLLYETLERSGLSVSRWFEDLDLLEPGSNRLVFAIGVDGWRLDSDAQRELARLARKGATVVVAYEPVEQGGGIAYDLLDDEDRDAPATKTNRTTRAARNRHAVRTNHVARATHFSHATRLDYVINLRREVPDDQHAVRGARMPDTFPSGLPSRTRLYFGSTSSAWRVMYKQDGHAVAIARTFGAGRVIALADAFPLSNEGIALNGTAAFVGALAAGSREAVFLEVLHGLRRDRTVGDLMAGYGLRAGLFALICWFGLYLWSSAVSLAPRRSVAEVAGRHVGRASTQGLAVLLQRAVKPSDLIRECWRLWMRNRPRESAGVRATAAKQLVLADDGRDALETYRRIATTLKGRK